jgi:hypothetical protein
MDIVLELIHLISDKLDLVLIECHEEIRVKLAIAVLPSSQSFLGLVLTLMVFDIFAVYLV